MTWYIKLAQKVNIFCAMRCFYLSSACSIPTDGNTVQSITPGDVIDTFHTTAPAFLPVDVLLIDSSESTRSASSRLGK